MVEKIIRPVADTAAEKGNIKTVKTILVIEENESIRANLSEWLELDKYKIVAASNGLSGLKLANEFIPDLIICNVMMSGMNGYEVLFALIKTPLTSKIPFIFSTCKSDKKDKVKAICLGADDYLVKPYELETLSVMAANWIRSGSRRPKISQLIM